MQVVLPFEYVLAVRCTKDTVVLLQIAPMGAEAADELSKAQKREMKWERKQAKLKAAAEAAGQTYVAPSKKEKEALVQKMGKRKKRKLASLEEGQTAEQSAIHGAVGNAAKPLSNGAPAEPAVLGMAEDQPKAERRNAKKAKKAAAIPSAASEAPATHLTDSDVQPKKKKKKSAKADAAAPEQTVEAEAAPASKSTKKTKAGLKGKVTVHQVLSSGQGFSTELPTGFQGLDPKYNAWSRSAPLHSPDLQPVPQPSNFRNF